MRRSKLQMHLEVLDALVFYGPLKLTHITYKANLNCSSLKPILKDLIGNGLVAKRKIKENLTVYAATNAARTTLLKFRDFSQILPIC